MRGEGRFERKCSDLRGDVNFRINFRFLNNPFQLPTPTKSYHETIVTTTGEFYSCGLNQWTETSSIGFAATNPTLQTPAPSTPEVFRPADASTWRRVHQERVSIPPQCRESHAHCKCPLHYCWQPGDSLRKLITRTDWFLDRVANVRPEYRGWLLERRQN